MFSKNRKVIITYGLHLVSDLYRHITKTAQILIYRENVTELVLTNIFGVPIYMSPHPSFGSYTYSYNTILHRSTKPLSCYTHYQNPMAQSIFSSTLSSSSSPFAHGFQPPNLNFQSRSITYPIQRTTSIAAANFTISPTVLPSVKSISQVGHLIRRFIF